MVRGYGMGGISGHFGWGDGLPKSATAKALGSLRSPRKCGGSSPFASLRVTMTNKN